MEAKITEDRPGLPDSQEEVEELHQFGVLMIPLMTVHEDDVFLTEQEAQGRCQEKREAELRRIARRSVSYVVVERTATPWTRVGEPPQASGQQAHSTNPGTKPLGE